jgi:hypothetical protein
MLETTTTFQPETPLIFRSLSQIVPHLIGIALFLVFEISHLVIMGISFQYYELIYLTIWEIIFFYFTVMITYPFLLKKRVHPLLVGLGLALNILLFLIVYMLIWYPVYKHIRNVGDFKIENQAYQLAVHRGFYMMLLASPLWIWLALLEKTKELNTYKVAFWQSQLQSHSILNSLNGSYNEVLGISEKGAMILSELSGVIRASLTKPDADHKVSLAKELQHIQDNIALHKLLDGEKNYFELHIDVPDDCLNLKMPPKLFFNLTENVFQHADLSKRSEPASLFIICRGNKIRFQTRNKKSVTSQHEGLGLGLHNTRLILDFMYPKKHRLTITEDKDWFILDMEIDL